MPHSIDLSVTGKPTPRSMHPSSAGKKRTPLTANRERNQKSRIFGNDDRQNYEKGVNSEKQIPHGVLSKTKLKEIQNLTNLQDNNSIQVAAYRSPRKVAPNGVPKLSLEDVTGKEDDLTYAKVATGHPKIHTPDSKDTVSWGTPLWHVDKQVKGGGWQVNNGRSLCKSAQPSTRRKHADVPDLDLKLSQSNDELAQLRKAAKEVKEDLEIEYLGASKLLEKNPNPGEYKKQEFIEQAILEDQVSRLKATEERPSTTPSFFGQYQPFDSRAKRHEELFNTRSMVTGVNDDLSKRFRFSARIISLNGQDAKRELNGFLFVTDDSLTMYEFRQFGSRANALPFIQRGHYSHVSGCRKDQPYCLLDIVAGRDLTFTTQNQPSLPDRLKQKPVVKFRITGTDDDDVRKKLLYLNCKTSKQKEEIDLFILKYKEDQKNSTQDILQKIQRGIRRIIESRGAKTMTTLFHHFKKLDKSGDGVLSKDEIYETLGKLHINIPREDYELVWDILDENNDNVLDYGEFVRGFFGEMNENRKAWVRKAFGRLDAKNGGSGEADNLYKFFCVSKHPSVLSGEMTEAGLFGYLEDVFQITKRNREISYQIFEAYYEGVSISLESDEDFFKLIKSTWTI